MDHAEAIAWVDAHAWTGVKPGLGRITGILELFDDPQHRAPVIHVAGTNGKTTVSRLATSILMGTGLRVGTFTSPHLHRLEERFPVDLTVMDEDTFVALVQEVRPLVDLWAERTGEGPTYFELGCILGFVHFAGQSVDAAVIEVGLGGRLDATKVVRPTVATVTSISRDHEAYLGSDLGGIADEKLAIVEPGSVLVTGLLPPEAEARALARADELGVTRLAADVDFSVADVTPAVGGWQVTLSGVYETYPDLFLPLHGLHQVQNLAVAVASVEAFFGRALDTDVLWTSLESASSPGRLEVIDHDPLVVMDGAHNPEGMAAAVASATTEFGVTEWTVVFGAMADKDIPAMLDHLRGVTGEIHTTAVAEGRAADPDDLAALVTARLGIPAVAHAEPRRALEAAIESAGPDGGVLVLGSLYLVGELRPANRKV